MSFLVIGGHAVNAYGISRQTGDLHILISQTEKDVWHELLVRLNYRATQNDNQFARYVPGEIAAWPIDIMLVDQSTFTKLQQDSIQMKIGVAEVKVVSARHLALLKIHALKVFQKHRFSKDFNDVLQLLQSGQTKISDAELEEMCSRYASHDLYEKLKAQLGRGNET